MPTQVLGHGMHRQVNTVLQWSRQARRAKSIVGHREHAAGFGNRGHFSQIMQAQAGVGQRLYPHQACCCGQTCSQAPLCGIHNSNSKTLAQRAKNPLGAAVQRPEERDFVTRFEQPQQQ
ncbi:hypothetical protein GALL_491140 [mine drainage metagenome]|uniref:Uncharacterized protein n=1 Tax=mine drainage metagenome TaxID=410659 RepID=A0A1J5PET8_9ZZZZ